MAHWIVDSGKFNSDEFRSKELLCLDAVHELHLHLEEGAHFISSRPLSVSGAS